MGDRANLARFDRLLERSGLKVKWKEEGIAEGELKGRLQAAKNFLAMGMPLKQIAQGTGLPIETIESLSKH